MTSLLIRVVLYPGQCGIQGKVVCGNRYVRTTERALIQMLSITRAVCVFSYLWPEVPGQADTLNPGDCLWSARGLCFPKTRLGVLLDHCWSPRGVVIETRLHLMQIIIMVFFMSWLSEAGTCEVEIRPINQLETVFVYHRVFPVIRPRRVCVPGHLHTLWEGIFITLGLLLFTDWNQEM